MIHKRETEERRSVEAGETEYQANILFTSFETRVFNILVGLLCAKIFRQITGMDVPYGVLPVFYLWLATSVAYLVLIKVCGTKRKKCAERLHFSYYFPATVYVTLLVHYLGGAGWVAFIFYFFDLVYANVLLERAKGIIVSVMIAVSYLTLVSLEYTGIVAPCRIFPDTWAAYDNLRYLLVTNVMVVGAVFFLMSYSTGLFSSMKQDREYRLIESKNRFMAKSRQLEEIARDLNSKIAENRYLKRAAMGYIEKKEKELELVRKDLEDQIEQLRRTQRSMFFMIKDLNEMSAQLKDTRDHLEEKVRDRTDELLDISRRLHRSERLAFLGKLAGSVTHELRNPMAVLKNAAYFLSKKFQNDKDAKVVKYLNMMKKELTVIDAIIDDIMGFAKTRSPELKETDIRDVVENALETISVPELVDVKKDLRDVPAVMIDSNQAMHAFMNIANNAIMAMNGNGTLTFTSFLRNDGYVCVSIKDTGPGIPPDQRELIFEPLYSSKPKGTGLGLPLAKMMVENQEGMIEMESEMGVGTTFTLCFPAREPDTVEG